MSKKRRIEFISEDFKTSISQIIPTKDDFIFTDKFTGETKIKEQSLAYKNFKQNLELILKEQLQGKTDFPSKKELFIFIVQYFSSNEKYVSYDLDNMAKTVLDTFKSHCYINDSQVKVLLAYKKMCNERVKENFAFVSVKILSDDKDLPIVLAAGLERSVSEYQSQVSKLQRAI